jgi:UDP-glucose 4-epimerase
MDFRCKRACVTGGAGFIGSHLVHALLNREIAVTVLDNLSIGRRENLPPGARLVVGDILDPDRVREALDGCDIVFHLAARVAIRSSFEFVVDDTQTNVTGTANLLRSVQQSRSVRKMITASSMAVYADSACPVPLPESHLTEPVSPYGISKLAAEKLTHAMCASAGIASVVLRLFNTYGPGQALSPYVGVITIFINRLKAGLPPTIYGDGEQNRDFVHVADVVQGLLCAMSEDIVRDTFNIGSGTPRSVNSVLGALQRVMETEIMTAHAPVVQGELRNSIADITRARLRLRYKPQREFDTSISEVVSQILRPSAQSIHSSHRAAAARGE